MISLNRWYVLNALVRTKEEVGRVKCKEDEGGCCPFYHWYIFFGEDGTEHEQKFFLKISNWEVRVHNFHILYSTSSNSQYTVESRAGDFNNLYKCKNIFFILYLFVIL